MTVATDAPSEEVFAGADSAAPLQIQWRFIDGDDLVVTAMANGIEGDLPLVRGVDYEVAGGGTGGGTVTPLAPIPGGVSWRVRRETPKGQPAGLPTSSYNPKQIEQALDRQGLAMQEHDREIDRALKLPRAGGQSVAGLFAAIDADGNVTFSPGTGADAGLRAALAAGLGAALMGVIRDAIGAVAESLLSWWRFQDVSIRSFGARTDADGAANAAAIQAAIDHAAANAAHLHIPFGRYDCDGVTLRTGLAGIRGPGWLVGTSAVPEAVVTCLEPVDGIAIEARIDGGDVARACLFLTQLTDATIGGRHKGVIADGGAAIRIRFPNCHDITIADAKITLAKPAYGDNPEGLFGIQVIAETSSPNGGADLTTGGGRTDPWATPLGDFEYPPVTVFDIRSINNVIRGGTHGLSYYGVAGFSSIGDKFDQQRDRNFIASPTCVRGRLVGQDLTGAGSAAIQLANGVRDVAVDGYTIDTSFAAANSADDCAIQTVGCENIAIGKGTIRGDWRWGIGIVHSRNIDVNAAMFGAGIAAGGGDGGAEVIVEATYAGNPKPGGATYARKRALGALTLNMVTENIRIANIGHSGAAACALALYQYGTAPLRAIEIVGAARQAATADVVHAYADNAALVTDVRTDRRRDGGNTVAGAVLAAGAETTIGVAIAGAPANAVIDGLSMTPPLDVGLKVVAMMRAAGVADVIVRNDTGAGIAYPDTNARVTARDRISFA